jgi:hypothetical protein
MPRTFRVPAGTDYPATAADYRLAREGKPHRRVRQEHDKEVTVPYSDLAQSFAANGFEEVKTHGVPERQGRKLDSV